MKSKNTAKKNSIVTKSGVVLPAQNLPISYTKEKNFHDLTQIKFLDDMKFIYGSVQINYKFDGVKYKKDPIIKIKWKSQNESIYDSSCNGLYILTGPISNCFVIDIDDVFNETSKHIMDLCSSNCNLICKTKKGFHYYFLYDEDFCQSNQYSEYGFDIRSDGGLIYCPPGYYYDENNKKIVYEYIKKPNDYRLNNLDTKLKKYLLDIINKKDNVKDKKNIIVKKKKELIDNVIPKKQNNDYIMKLLKGDLSYSNLLYDALIDCVKNLDENRNYCYKQWVDIGMVLVKFGDYGIELWKEFSKKSSIYDEQEINDKVATFNTNQGLDIGSLFYWLKVDNKVYFKKFLNKHKQILQYLKMDMEDLEAIELERYYYETDRGFIKMYYNKYRDKIYCTSQKAHTFLIYNKKNQLWEYKTVKDIQNHFMDNMKYIIKPLIEYYQKQADVSRKTNMDLAKEYDKRVLKISYIPEFYKASKSNPLMPLIESQFYNDNIVEKLNNNNDLLPVKNGIINLKTGEFRNRTHSDYFTFELDVEWKGLDYPTTDFDKFFDDIMLSDKTMINYLQRLLGYSITGYTNEQLFIVFWGDGSNGKGKLQNFMRNLMSQYYRQLTSDVVIDARKPDSGAASPHLMQLLGSRVAFVDESSAGDKLNDQIVKNATGDSTIVARPLYGEHIKINPTFQLFLLTNHKPEIKVVDHALERRIILIPFLACFKDKKDYDKDNKTHKLKNKDIEEILSAKLDQLLVWLVNGSVKYFSEGFGDRPDVIDKATKGYIKENDDLVNLIEDLCVKDVNGFVYHSDLFDTYRKDYDNKISGKGFTNLMKKKGYDLSRRSEGRGFKGLKLKKNILDE